MIAGPLFINITENSDGAVIVRWKTPPSVNLNNAPRIALTGCDISRQKPIQQRLVGSEIYLCENGLSRNSLAIDYPLFNPSIASLLRIEFKNGETYSVILDPGQMEWRIPAPATFAGVVRAYFALGVEHIFGGIDHLLFLAGLLYIARTPTPHPDHRHRLYPGPLHHPVSGGAGYDPRVGSCRRNCDCLIDCDACHRDRPQQSRFTHLAPTGLGRLRLRAGTRGRLCCGFGGNRVAADGKDQCIIII